MAETSQIQSRLIAMVETYGADLELWPTDALSPAERTALETPTPELQSAMVAARQLDDLLETLPQPDPSDALARRILETAPGPTTPSLWVRLSASFAARPQLLPTTGAMASLVVGLVVGLTFPTSAVETDTTTEDDEIIYAALGLTDFVSELERDAE